MQRKLITATVVALTASIALVFTATVGASSANAQTDPGCGGGAICR